MCYVWSNQDYKLALILLNQVGTKLTNHKHIWATWANYYMLLMDRGVTSPRP